MIVVSDTTPLSELAKIGQLVLLRDVFGQVIVPQEVYDEVTSGTHPAVGKRISPQLYQDVLAIAQES